MESLGRYPLSVVLSFLTETEGTCLLITKKKYVASILPLFRLRGDVFNGLHINQKANKPRHRHRFMVVPVQDPTVLLARLNTRRLGRRKTKVTAGLTTTSLATQEWAAAAQTFQHPPELELLRFLDKRHCINDKDNDLHRIAGGGTVLVSYPRSGNSLLRTLLERTTGVVTGSDTRPDRALSRELAEIHNLVGEGVTQTQCPFVKSHWPERSGNTVALEAKRAILVVRNPFDVIDSYWNMNATKTHTQTVTDAVYDRFRDKFQALVENEIHIWLRFHEYWLHSENCRQIPVLVVRFEDLIQDANKELVRILEFSFGQQSGEGLSDFWMQRIQHVTGNPIDKLGSYRPRGASKGVDSIGKSLRKGRYSDELLQTLHAAASNSPGENLLQSFGYDIFAQGFPNNFKEGTEPLVDRLDRQHSTIPDTDTNKAQTAAAVVKMNVGAPVRPYDCPFGRALQSWRHSVTNKDAEPLPTVPR
jgi:hypothetical protein